MAAFLDEKNKSAYQYLISVLPQFERICKPLFDLGIPYFGYMKIFENGSYLTVDNKLEYQSLYLSIIKDIGLVFNDEFDKIFDDKYRYFIIPSDIKKFDPCKDPILHLLYDFNIWNILSIYKKNTNNNFIECYSFSMTRNDTWATNFYLNNIPLLERFIDYFNEKAKDLINTEDKRKLAYFEQQFNFANNSKDELLTAKVKRYLEETMAQQRIMIKGKDKDAKLSRRELECLQYLALGNSAKEIAKHLGLSPRTVEHYLRNMKEKTGYYCRSQLITSFVKNNHLVF